MDKSTSYSVNSLPMATFWNVSDRYSWLDKRGGGKAYPLLFDTTYQPKKVFWQVVNFNNNETFMNSDKRGF